MMPRRQVGESYPTLVKTGFLASGHEVSGSELRSIKGYTSNAVTTLMRAREIAPPPPLMLRSPSAG